jgi:hypothetical protein
MCRIDDISIRAQFRILDNNNGTGMVICMLSQSNVLLNEGTYELDILLSSGQSLLSPSEISHAHNVSVQKIPDFFQIMPSSLSYRKNSNIDVSIEWSADFHNPFDSDGTHHEGVDDRESLLSCHFYADHSTSRMVVPAILIDNNKIQCRVSEHLMGPFFLTTLHDVLYITVALSGKGSDIAEIGKISVLRGYEVNCIEPHIILSGVDTMLRSVVITFDLIQISLVSSGSHTIRQEY